MKQQMMRVTTFRFPGISRAIGVPAAILFFVLFAQAQSTQILPPMVEAEVASSLLAVLKASI